MRCAPPWPAGPAPAGRARAAAPSSPPRESAAAGARIVLSGAGMTASEVFVSPRRRRMWDVLAALGRPRVALMLLMGISSGLPFMLIGNTLGGWLKAAGVG